jgi:hypothetical protein
VTNVDPPIEQHAVGDSRLHTEGLNWLRVSDLDCQLHNRTVSFCQRLIQ